MLILKITVRNYYIHKTFKYKKVVKINRLCTFNFEQQMVYSHKDNNVLYKAQNKYRGILIFIIRHIDIHTYDKYNI